MHVGDAIVTSANNVMGKKFFLTSRFNKKLYFGLFFSNSLSAFSYSPSWPFTSVATARMNVSVTASASS